MENQHIRTISDRIVKAQGPIRVLDSIKWHDSTRVEFFERNAQSLPRVDTAYYQSINLGFSTNECRQEFKSIIKDIDTLLDLDDPLTQLMRKMCYEYIGLLDLIEARGQPIFYEISKNLYGHTEEAFHTNGPTLIQLGELLDDSLKNIDSSMFLEQSVKTMTTKHAVRRLKERFDMAFDATGLQVKVIESDGIVADAAAGSDYIKLRKDALFSVEDLRVLEVHEGWVHVGTTHNGNRQNVCTFLSKGTPSCTVTQEGLAVFIEVISFCSHPARLQRISDRIRAVHMAEQGADFLEIYRYLINVGRNEEDAYTTTMRIFRGSTPTGKPFTKDLAYAKGFIDVYNFIRLAVRRGKLYLIELLFCGKLSIADMGTIANAFQRGLIRKPDFLPPPIVNLEALIAWMAFSNFLNRLDLKIVEEDFSTMFDMC